MNKGYFVCDACSGRVLDFAIPKGLASKCPQPRTLNTGRKVLLMQEPDLAIYQIYMA